MSPCVVLKKSDLDRLIIQLSRFRKVMAPVKHGIKNYAFEEVTSADQISLTYIPTILPPKKYYMPQRETLQAFDRAAHQWKPVVGESAPTLIFGVHTCDLAGIQFLNKVMAYPPQDTNYQSRAKHILTIGFECNDYCDEYASCRVMNNYLPNGGYDLMFTDLGKYFIVAVGTPEGENLVKEAGCFEAAGATQAADLEKLRKKKEQIFKSEVSVGYADLKGVFEKGVRSEVWEDIDGRCVACGNCTNVCPTCYCFDIKDALDLNLNTGCRVRVWDSCQNEEFAKVAGGENFRHKRGQRQRHRYMRKFSYPVEKYGTYSCTGCGRCTRTCMAKISLKETINALAESDLKESAPAPAGKVK